MPYTHRVTVFPANGATVALRAVLETQIHARKVAGYRCGLGQVIYGAPSPHFDLVFAFDSLGDLEKFRNDPISAVFASQVAALTSQGPGIELAKQLLAVPAGPNPAYTTSTTIFPATGKIVALREALVANAKEEQAEGARIGVSTGHGGAPRVVVTRLFASFADLDEIGPKPSEARAARVANLFAAPPVTEIRQVLVGLN